MISTKIIPFELAKINENMNIIIQKFKSNKKNRSLLFVDSGGCRCGFRIISMWRNMFTYITLLVSITFKRSTNNNYLCTYHPVISHRLVITLLSLLNNSSQI